MNRTVLNFFNSLSRIFPRKPQYAKNLPHLSFSNENYVGVSESRIKEILQKRFPEAKEIQVEDVSGGCGAMYDIYVETKDFKGISIAKQHQAIYTVLKEQIKQIHGLRVVTKVPEC